MGWADHLIEKLKNGEEVVCYPRGNSMTPKIKSGDRCCIVPIVEPLEKGDIVLCRVNGNQYLHLITSIKDNRYRISNNHGHDNGWIGLKDIFGILKSVG